MGSYENFYEGADYGLDSTYGTFTGYRAKASQIAFPTDPLTANQLKKVSDKISTGTKNIEVSGLGLTGGSPMKHLASIPKQHWKEIDRLRKLTGVELTFHGPLVEPTGVGKGNWSEDQREEVERQMKQAISLAQEMDPKGNMVVTFHASNGLPEVKRTVKTGDGEKITQMAIVNERTGEIGNLPFSKEDHFGKIKQRTAEEQLESMNHSRWNDMLEGVVKSNNLARKEIESALSTPGELGVKPGEKEAITELYNLSKLQGIQEIPKEYEQEYKKRIEELNPQVKQIFEQSVKKNLDDANFFLEDSYHKLKEAYNNAYDIAKNDNDKESLKKLESFQKKYKPQMNNFLKGAGNFEEMNTILNEGVNTFQKIKAPEIYKPLEGFAIDKASESFANTALYGLKKFGQHAPIISIENPPAGMSGLTRGQELKDLTKKSREKFITKAIETGISKSEAKKQADKLIGVTWDVGHINSIRKWGYDEADVIGEAKKVAPYVKHMHLADNLGFEDSELPIGMGNVPIEKIIKLNKNFQNAKKVIETGDWFSRQGGLGMQHTPVLEAFAGLGSPVYAMGESPYWNQASTTYGSYFGGLGPINPEIHHSTYGAGFTNLPAYQGGEMPGGSNSSFSGAPIN